MGHDGWVPQGVRAGAGPHRTQQDPRGQRLLGPPHCRAAEAARGGGSARQDAGPPKGWGRPWHARKEGVGAKLGSWRG